MHIKNIQKFIAVIHTKIEARFGQKPHDTTVLMSMVKLSEEVGELSEVVLQSFGRQREEKMSKLSSKNISHEMADVVLSIFMLAQELNIDLEEALLEKMSMIEKRF